jgi:hypothetical protein
MLEPAPGIYGYVETPEKWEQFRLRWSDMLKKHGAEYFHFCELDPNFQKKHPENPFSTWDSDRKDDFIYDMAFVAGSGPIPFGGNRPQKQHKTALDAFAHAFENFFSDFSSQMDDNFPNEKGKTSFFFAKNTDASWNRILTEKMNLAIQRDTRIAEEHTCIEPKTERGMPCQASDILAYVHRQNVSQVYDKGFEPMRILDFLVGRQMLKFSPQYHPLVTMGDAEWYDLVQDMRRCKKKFDAARSRLGLPKKQYFPAKEHPSIRKINQKYIAFKRAFRK